MDFRDHPASEVFVTGTFDDWARSVKLEKKANSFEKRVELPSADEKIYYKVRSDSKSRRQYTQYARVVMPCCHYCHVSFPKRVFI